MEVSESRKPQMQPFSQHGVHLHASDSVEDDGPLSTLHCENNQMAVSGWTNQCLYAYTYLYTYTDNLPAPPTILVSQKTISKQIREQSVLCSGVTCVCSFFDTVSQRSSTDEEFDPEASASRTTGGHPACNLPQLLQKTLREREKTMKGKQRF